MDNIESGSFTDTFCRKTYKFQKSVSVWGGGVLHPPPHTHIHTHTLTHSHTHTHTHKITHTPLDTHSPVDFLGFLSLKITIEKPYN